MDYFFKWLPVIVLIMIVCSSIWINKKKEKIACTSVAIILGIKDQEEKIEGILRSLITLISGLDNIELIIVDKFSKDKTLEIVQKIHNKYPIFRYVQSSSTAGVINSCKGQVICILEVGERLTFSDAIESIRFIIDKNKTRQ